MAGDHEESGRSNSRRDPVESQKSVDEIASSNATTNVKNANVKNGSVKSGTVGSAAVKSDAETDDDWGYEPKKAGMAIEAKMGMCIVVILLSAFGFLVYRKFDARQRDLLQANLQAAEKSLPGSTSREFVGEYSEFQKSDGFADTGFVADSSFSAGATEQSLASDIDLQDLDTAASFGSTFALQDERPQEPTEPDLADTVVAAESSGPFAGNPFDDSPFGNLAEPDAAESVSNSMPTDESVAVAFATDSSEGKPAGQMGSALDDYLNQRVAKEEAKQQQLSANGDAPKSSFAAFGDPAPAVASTAIDSQRSGQSAGFPEQVDVSDFEESQQVAESKSSPSFDSFPAGFEPEFQSTTDSNSDDAVWVKTDSTISSGQLEPLPKESFEGITDSSTAVESGSSTLVENAGQQSIAEFEGFNSFADESKDTTTAIQPDKNMLAESPGVDWSAGGPSGVTTAQESSIEKSGVASKSSTISQPPGFADFAATEESPFSSNRSAMDSSQPFSGGFDEPIDPLPSSAGLSESFASESRPSLSPFSGAADDFDKVARADQRRSPSIDPSAVIGPLSSVDEQNQFGSLDNSIQLAQTDLPSVDQPWDINRGRTPLGGNGTALVSRTSSREELSQQVDGANSSVDDGLVDSFSDVIPLPTPGSGSGFGGNLDSSESLRKPRLPNFRQGPVISNNRSFGNTTGLHIDSEVTSQSGKIQQVSATRDPDGIYTVKPDDTYWTISKHAYGTARFFSSLALYNKNRIKDPRKLREGMKVVIPDPQVLIERYPELLQDYLPKKTMPSGYFLKPDGMPAYRIGERETLSEISQKHLGRASRWIQLYRMNQHVLKNPNRLKPGTVIDLPDDATNVHMVP